MDPQSSAGALVPALTLLMAAVAVITTNLWAHNIAMHPCSFLFEIDQWNLKVKKYKNWIYLQPLTINEKESMGKRGMESWQAYLDCHYYKTNDNKMTMMNQTHKIQIWRITKERNQSNQCAHTPLSNLAKLSPHALHVEFSASCVCTFLEVYTCAWVHPQILGEHIQILGSGYNVQHALTKLEFTTQTSVNYLNRCYILTKWQSCKAHLCCTQLQYVFSSLIGLGGAIQVVWNQHNGLWRPGS